MSASSTPAPNKHPRPTGGWRSGGGMPLIGITPDVVDRNGRVTAMCALAYAEAIAEAGGVPVILSPVVGMIPEYLRRLQGLVLTGGDDPRMEPFGVPTDPRVTPVHTQRQGFEMALLSAIDGQRDALPVLGVCLGMQMLALHAGGKLDQYMPDSRDDAHRHWGAEHVIVPLADAALPVAAAIALTPGIVHSHHRQAVTDPGSLRVVATSDDGVIEAIASAEKPFVLGVQWHPERTKDPTLGVDLFKRLVAAARM